MRNKFLFALRRRLDYFELLAIAAILLGVAIIAGIVFTYDLSRQTVLDDARAQAQLYSKLLPDDVWHKRTRLAGITGAAICSLFGGKASHWTARL
jgi:hypothetical protein